MDKYITAAQLIEGSEMMIGAAYTYGCFGMWGNEEVYQAKKKQYPTQITKWPKSTYVETYGERWVDCIGLIKFLASLRGRNYLITDKSYNPKYKDIEAIDWSANGTIEHCEDVVSFSDMPEVPGMAVWKNGHIGIFIKTLPDGRKLVREAAGHMKGVIETTGTAWKKAGKLPYVDYSNTPTPTPTPTPGGDIELTVKTLRKGTKDPNVLVFQSMMNTLNIRDDEGLPLDEDSSFGPRSVQACKRFQTKKGLTADGICGPKTWDRIANG